MLNSIYVIIFLLATSAGCTAPSRPTSIGSRPKSDKGAIEKWTDGFLFPLGKLVRTNESDLNHHPPCVPPSRFHCHICTWDADWLISVLPEIHVFTFVSKEDNCAESLRRKKTNSLCSFLIKCQRRVTSLHSDSRPTLFVAKAFICVPLLTFFTLSVPPLGGGAILARRAVL